MTDLLIVALCDTPELLMWSCCPMQMIAAYRDMAPMQASNCRSGHAEMTLKVSYLLLTPRKPISACAAHSETFTGKSRLAWRGFSPAGRPNSCLRSAWLRVWGRSLLVWFDWAMRHSQAGELRAQVVMQERRNIPFSGKLLFRTAHQGG